MIYLDAAATAKYRNVDDIIVDTIATAMRDSWMNPSSLYANNIKDKIDKCRANIAKFIHAKSDEVIFTSGSSESNNMAIRGWVDYNLINTSQFINVITTPIEHKSILETVKNEALGARVQYCGIDKFGMVDCHNLERLLSASKHEPILVSVCMANNEIGVIQDIKKISDLVHKYGGILHIDATQALGHIPIDVEELEVDLMSASGHKISPVLRGIGFLYKKKGINIQPFIYGAQENGLRGGTENTYGILGLSKAIEYCDTNYKTIEKLCEKRDYLIGILESKLGCILNGHRKRRLPNNINVVLPKGIAGESILYVLSMSNVFVSTSSACNSHSIIPSEVLKGIGLKDDEAMRSIRVTISEDITYDDIDYFIRELDKAIKVIRV